MTVKRRGRKTIFTIGGVIVFIAGVVIGSFLVLRSTISEGGFFSVSNTDEGIAAYVANEVLALRASGYANYSGDSTDLTSKFASLIFKEGEENNLTQADYESDEFFQEVIIPFISAELADILSRDPDINVVSSASADLNVYMSELGDRVIIIAGSWQKIVTISPNSIDEKDVRENLGLVLTILEANEKDLADMAVPLEWVELHKKTLRLSFLLRALVQYGYLEKSADPFQALVVISALLEETAVVGQEVVREVFSSSF